MLNLATLPPRTKARYLAVAVMRVRALQHDYSSTQVNLPEKLAEQILVYGKSIPDADLAADGREDEIHATVKYGLHTQSADKVRKVIKDFGIVSLTLGKTACFEGGEYDVLHVSVDSPDLVELNALVSEALPVTDTHPTYIPHVCVAYLKPGVGWKYVGDKRFVGQTAEIEKVVFSPVKGRDTQIKVLGGPGSGNFGHSGRPGEVGGSGESGLADGAKLNGGHYVDAHKIAFVSEVVLQGGDAKSRAVDAGADERHIAAAQALVNAVREAPESDAPLYRGIASDALLESYAPGQTVTMGRLTSFTAERGYGALYADKNSGSHKYEFRLEGPSKSLATDKMTGQTHQEHLTQGKFEIVRVEKSDERVAWPENFGKNHVRYEATIVLRQVGVF